MQLALFVAADPLLFHYLARNVESAVPIYRSEHFIPLFYAMGVADDEKSARLLNHSYRYGNLSQSIWLFAL